MAARAARARSGRAASAVVDATTMRAASSATVLAPPLFVDNGGTIDVAPSRAQEFAMFGSETVIMRISEDAMAPRVRAGDYVWIDPDEPAADGSLVAVRDPARGGETVVRLLVERDGRRILRALDEHCPERTVDADNETNIRGVVVFVGNTV